MPMLSINQACHSGHSIYLSVLVKKWPWLVVCPHCTQSMYTKYIYARSYLQNFWSPKLFPRRTFECPTPTVQSMEGKQKHGNKKDPSGGEKGRSRPSSSLSRECQSSIPSLGSFMEAESVAKAFSSPNLAEFKSLTSSSSSNLSSWGPARTESDPVSTLDDKRDKQCPHCKKFFTNPWAVTKHVLVCGTENIENEDIYHNFLDWKLTAFLWGDFFVCVCILQNLHDRSGYFHCVKCTFNTRVKDKLLQHEKEYHRKCPYCNQIFLLLSKHIPTCQRKYSSSSSRP